MCVSVCLHMHARVCKLMTYIVIVRGSYNASEAKVEIDWMRSASSLLQAELE